MICKEDAAHLSVASFFLFLLPYDVKYTLKTFISNIIMQHCHISAISLFFAQYILTLFK